MTYYQKAMGRKDAYASYRYAMCLIKGYADREGKVNRPDIEKGYNLLL